MIRNVLMIVYLSLIPTLLISQETSLSSPPVNLIFPGEKDTVYTDYIRIAGNTSPNAKVSINDHDVRVFSSGAFVDRIALQPNWNRIKIVATLNGKSTSKNINMFRIPPVQTSPSIPTHIEKETLFPNQNMLLLSGDRLTVRFKGSPGGRAIFNIEDLARNIPMSELDPQSTANIGGIYSGVIEIKTDHYIDPRPVQVELKGMDGKKIKFNTTALIEVRPREIPLIGEITDETYLRNGVSSWSVINTLPAGTRIHIVGKEGDVYKIQLSTADYAYVSDKDVKRLPAGTPVPETTIGLPGIAFKNEWLQLSMPITTPCPFLLDQSIDPPSLELTVYGARLSSQWITFPKNKSEIKLISWSQPSADIFKLRVDLNQSQQWGHRVRFERGQMILEIRRTPNFSQPPGSSLNGLTIVLDSGHGGVEKGAVGPTGLMEKDVNINYARKLAVLLKKAGANVVFTRTTDSTMTLRDRMKIAREANAHIFCWLHNNSIGSSGDPMAVRGTSTYFTVPQNQQLSAIVYQRLLELGLDPFGHVHNDYYVTRQTDMLIVLVEGAFMSHPADEILLMDNQFLESLARAVFLGLEDFCNEQRQKGPSF